MAKWKRMLLFTAVVGFILFFNKPPLTFSAENSNLQFFQGIAVEEISEVTDTEGTKEAQPKSAPVTAHVIDIPAAAFVSDGILPNSTTFSIQKGCRTGTGTGGGCLIAPVSLPIGAVIVQMCAYVINNDGTWATGVGLRRVVRGSGAPSDATNMAVVLTSAVTPDIVMLCTSAITEPVIYGSYSYFLYTCLNTAAESLYSVRIWYNLEQRYHSLTLD